MTECPFAALPANSAKFAPLGAFWGEHGLHITPSGKGVTIAGDMWPVSQLRVGAETQYGREIFAATWLLRERGIASQGAASEATARLAQVANIRKREVHG